jgi:Domain of unknown function (DUF4265)
MLTNEQAIMNDASTPNAKVLFRVSEEDGSAQVETLWATSLGGDQYKLDNSPFYAYSVSWEDVVYAPHDPAEGRPTFQRVVKKSGNRTVRVIFDPPVEDGNRSDKMLQGLVALGCSYEGANRGYMSINIPAEVKLQHVREYLIFKEAQWEHADPSHSELFPDDGSSQKTE